MNRQLPITGRRKLARTVERDQDVTDELIMIGWMALWFLQRDIKKNLQMCVDEVDMAKKPLNRIDSA